MRTYFVTSRSKEKNAEWMSCIQEQMVVMNADTIDKDLPSQYGPAKGIDFNCTSHVDWVTSYDSVVCVCVSIELPYERTLRRVTRCWHVNRSMSTGVHGSGHRFTGSLSSSPGRLGSTKSWMRLRTCPERNARALGWRCWPSNTPTSTPLAIVTARKRKKERK